MGVPGAGGLTCWARRCDGAVARQRKQENSSRRNFALGIKAITWNQKENSIEHGK